MSSTDYPSPNSFPTSPSVAIGILPPLPEIRSRQIRKRAFTHSSLSLAGENRYEFQAPEGEPADNEELAQIGDQAFGLTVTDLIQNLYPYLRVGRAAKVRDRTRRKSLIAEISVSYGLHMKVNLPESQADSLRASQSVQVNVFKAYVGGLYRDQGLDVIRKWIIPLVRPHVEAAYQYPRDDYVPEAIAVHGVPMASYPSPPPSSASSDGAGSASPTTPSPLAWNPDPHRSLRQRVNVPPQGSGRVGGGVESHPKDIDQSRSNDCRRRSGQGNGGSGDSDGTRSPNRHTGSDRSKSASKRHRY